MNEASGPRWLEVIAVAVTGLLHLLVSEHLGLQGAFIAVAVVGWGTWLALQVRRHPGRGARWGFTRQDLGASAVVTSSLALAALALMAAYGSSRGPLPFDLGLAALLVVYPLWGLLQQLLVQGLVAGNLVRARGIGGRPATVVLVCAVLFGLVHVPDLRLTLLTFLMGILFTPIYLRWRNLWPLGVWHGWLGAFAYRWVLARDPWTDLFG